MSPLIRVAKLTSFPLHLFLFFENLSLCYWTSTAVKPRHVVTFWPEKASTLFGKTLSLELNLAQSFLVDASVIDTSAYSPDILEFNKFLKANKFLSFYIFYCYFLKLKITVCFSASSKLGSLEGSYPNASWLEREMAEMYGLKIGPKKDSRNLLLDYTSLAFPMQRSYPCAGTEEIFFNPLEDSLVYYPNTSVEL